MAKTCIGEKIFFLQNIKSYNKQRRSFEGKFCSDLKEKVKGKRKAMITAGLTAG